MNFVKLFISVHDLLTLFWDLFGCFFIIVIRIMMNWLMNS